VASILATHHGDRPLRRSFHLVESTAAFLAKAGFLDLGLQLNVSSFRSILARERHRADQCGTVRQETVPPMPCFAANPQGRSDFGVPAYAAGRLWCPARGVFPAPIRVGIATTSTGVGPCDPSVKVPAWKNGHDHLRHELRGQVSWQGGPALPSVVLAYPGRIVSSGP
jgi:hypothetical protein